MKDEILKHIYYQYLKLLTSGSSVHEIKYPGASNKQAMLLSFLGQIMHSSQMLSSYTKTYLCIKGLSAHEFVCMNFDEEKREKIYASIRRQLRVPLEYAERIMEDGERVEHLQLINELNHERALSRKWQESPNLTHLFLYPFEQVKPKKLDVSDHDFEENLKHLVHLNVRILFHVIDQVNPDVAAYILYLWTTPFGYLDDKEIYRKKLLQGVTQYSGSTK